MAPSNFPLQALDIMHAPLLGQKKYYPYLLIAPTLIWVIVFMIFPLVYSLNLSFSDWNPPNPPAFIGARNYAELLYDPRFSSSLLRTFFFTGITVCVEFVLGLLVALSITKLSPRIAERINIVSIIPIVMTPVITGILWRIILNSEYGILNYYLHFLGFPRYIAWLSSPDLSLFSCMIVDIWHWTPFVALAFTAGIGAIPKEPLEAAQIDGASYWNIFRNIMLPFLHTIIMLVLLLRIVESMLFFDVNYILTMGGPGISSELVSLYIYKSAFWFWHLGYSSAMSYIILIIADIVGMTLFVVVLGRRRK